MDIRDILFDRTRITAGRFDREQGVFTPIEFAGLKRIGKEKIQPPELLAEAT